MGQPLVNLPGLVVGVTIGLQHQAMHRLALRLVDQAVQGLLFLAGGRADLDAATDGLAVAFLERYRLWLEEGFRPVREAWLSRAIGLGREIKVTFREGDTDSGVFSALDESGALVLTRGGASRMITAGEIFFAA